MKENNCPNKKQHTECPDGYLEWHTWALQHSRRHKQTRCPGCGLFTIWVQREANEADYGGDEWLIEMAKYG